MHQVCGHCRVSWVDAATGRCLGCGASAAGPPSAQDGGPRAAAPLPAYRPAALVTGGGGFQTLTPVTGVDAERFHGVPFRVEDVDITRMQLSPFEGFLLSLIDGLTNVDDVVAASGLSIPDAARALFRLKGVGVIRFQEDHLRAVGPAPLAGNPAPVALTPAPFVLPVDPPAVPLPGEDVPTRVRAAQDAVHAGDYETARWAVRQVLDEDPNHEAALALDALLGPAERAPERAATLARLAEDAERDNRVQDAITLYRRSLEEHDGAAQSHFNLGVMQLRNTGASPDVLHSLQRACELDPDNMIFRTMLERVRTFLHRKPRA